MQAHLGVVSKAAKAARLDSVTVAGVMKIDTSAIGRPDGLTLTDALALLQWLAKKPVALIVDEAQHAPTSAEGENRFEQQVLDAADRQQRGDEAQMESEFLALRPIEQVVLWRLLRQGSRFRPYDADALRFYQDKLDGREPAVKVTAQTAQTAVESIRDRTPSLVWKSARGEYPSTTR